MTNGQLAWHLRCLVSGLCVCGGSVAGAFTRTLSVPWAAVGVVVGLLVFSWSLERLLEYNRGDRY